MQSFEELYNSLSNDQKLLLEQRSMSIWEDISKFCIRYCVGVFAFHEMRQLIIGGMRLNAMANFEEGAYFLENPELFRLPYLIVERSKTQELIDHIQHRIPIYKKILQGTVNNEELIQDIEIDDIVKMEFVASRVAAYTINNVTRDSAFWYQDCSILDFLKPFAISMLYSIKLLYKMGQKDLDLVNIDTYLPDWFKQPTQPNDEYIRLGFKARFNKAVRQINEEVVVKEVVSKTEGNFKSMNITLEIEVRVLYLFTNKY